MKFWLFIVTCIYFLQPAKGNLFHERLQIRKNFTNLVLKQDEIVQFRLNDYFGGSMNQYSLRMKVLEGEPQRGMYEYLKRIFQLNEPYNSILVDEDLNARNLPPNSDMHVLVIVPRKTRVDRVLILFIDEEFRLIITDFTNPQVENSRTVGTLNLLRVLEHKLTEFRETIDEDNYCFYEFVKSKTLFQCPIDEGYRGKLGLEPGDLY